MSFPIGPARPVIPPLGQGQQPFNYTQYQPQISQPIFPQPSGNAYFVNNSLEVANIPIGAGMSAVLCLSENLLYIKSLQNGVPSLLGFKLVPLETPTPAPVDTKEDTTAATTVDNSIDLQQELQNKIKNLEDSIKELQDKIGGLIECNF